MNTSTISTLASPDVLALTIRSSPRSNLKLRSLVYDAVRGNNAGSPEGTTTLKEKSAVFRDGYRSRPVRAEIWDRCCVIRGESCHRKPSTRSAKGARFKVDDNGSFVL